MDGTGERVYDTIIEIMQCRLLDRCRRWCCDYEFFHGVRSTSIPCLDMARGVAGSCLAGMLKASLTESYSCLGVRLSFSLPLAEVEDVVEVD